MDEQKVREAINQFKAEVEAINNTWDSFLDYVKPSMAKKLELLETAIEALEKQLPKKPLMTEDKQFALCPCCDGRGLLDNQSYCNDCGQHIDWTEQS